jgi:hypothetical protein
MFIKIAESLQGVQTKEAFSYLPLLYGSRQRKVFSFYHNIHGRCKMEQKTCDERHKAVDEKLNRHERWLGEHEGKLDTLSKSDATNTQSIKELCGKISELVTTIRWLIGLLIGPVIVAAIGFFIWYIQSLPR